MKTFAILVLLACAVGAAQVTDQLSPEEVKAAIAAKPNSGFAMIFDMAFGVASSCQVQSPSEDIFTPAGWINARAASARGQYQEYQPNPEDSSWVMRVISHGCVNGTAAGPVCDSITRVVLLSDKQGTAKVEAVSAMAKQESWQNGFGATATCLALVSKFAMADLPKVRNDKGEFLIATFSGPTLLKIYTVKQKYIKQLGL